MSLKIVPDSSGEGNTHSLPVEQKVPKQSPLRKNHFFTYNNYKEEIVPILIETLQQFAFKGKVQSEVGKDGTPHLQGMIWCKDKHRDTEFKLPKQIHWETLKDTDNSRDYCGKDDTHDGRFRFSWGFPKPIEHNVLWNTWNIWLLDTIKSTPDNRTIHWFWSERGKMGKTNFTRYLVDKHNAQFCSGGKYTDVMNLIYNTDMDVCNTVIFTLPREHKNHISYSALESVKDGLVCNMKSYANGSKIFNPPHIIIFANYPPDTKHLSSDRWNIRQLDFMHGK